MPEIAIPRQFLGGIHRLAQLSPEDRKLVLGAIQDETPVVSRTPWAETIAKRVPSISVDEAAQMTVALLGMSTAAANSTTPLSEFVNAVVASLPVADRPGNAADLQEFLVAALSIPTLVISAKAVDILTSHQRIYLRGRMFTDMRPVFGSDASAGPRAAVITHTLRLSVRDGQDYTDFYFALDTSDIRKLRAILDRAEEKESQLMSTIKNQGIEYVPVVGEDA